MRPPGLFEPSRDSKNIFRSLKNRFRSSGGRGVARAARAFPGLKKHFSEPEKSISELRGPWGRPGCSGPRPSLLHSLIRKPAQIPASLGGGVGRRPRPRVFPGLKKHVSEPEKLILELQGPWGRPGCSSFPGAQKKHFLEPEKSIWELRGPWGPPGCSSLPGIQKAFFGA